MKKTLGLIVAAKTEFKTIFKTIENESFEQIESSPFVIYKIKIEDKNVYAILSGVGEILASAATQYLIDHYNVNIILNYGVVGALVENLSVNNIVLIEKTVDCEFDTTPIDDCEIGEHLGLKKGRFFEADKNLINLAQSIEPSLKTVICASSNKFIHKIEDKEYLHSTFGAEICEMESAGIALVAYLNKLPVLYIKGVSDSKTGGASEFKHMFETSSEVTYKLVKKIVSNLN